jgi:hypothetical protein
MLNWVDKYIKGKMRKKFKSGTSGFLNDIIVVHINEKTDGMFNVYSNLPSHPRTIATVETLKEAKFIGEGAVRVWLGATGLCLK